MRKPTLPSLGLLALALAGCGGDPFVGTYTFTDVRAIMLTKPISNNSSNTYGGTLVVTNTSGSGYQLAFTYTDSNGNMSMCNLGAVRQSDLLSVTAGQACTFPVTNGMVTATVTMGSGSLMSGKLDVTLAYNVTGSSGAFAIEGTGTDVVTATMAMSK